MVEVVNRQRSRKMPTSLWRERTENMLAAIEKTGASVTVAFVSDARIRSLNKSFSGIDATTDVLSFPAESETTPLSDELGDIAISVQRAASQAKDNGLTFEEEVAQLILHGLLHLCGYDHETDNGEMDRLELTLRKKLGL